MVVFVVLSCRIWVVSVFGFIGVVFLEEKFRLFVFRKLLFLEIGIEVFVLFGVFLF